MSDEPPGKVGKSHGPLDVVHAFTVLADVFEGRAPQWIQAHRTFLDFVLNRGSLENAMPELVELAGVAESEVEDETGEAH